MYLSVMAIVKPDREKYIEIARTQGVHEAITQLHHEMISIEFESFEGPKGYQPDMWESIKAFRALSIDLWKLRPEESGNPYPPSFKRY